MMMVTSRRWLLAAILPLVLAACTSTAGQRGAGTGTTATAAGSGSPARQAARRWQRSGTCG
jgi:outer membrane biogenesis lipoprotein LolB